MEERRREKINVFISLSVFYAELEEREEQWAISLDERAQKKH